MVYSVYSTEYILHVKFAFHVRATLANYIFNFKKQVTHLVVAFTS